MLAAYGGENKLLAVDVTHDDVRFPGVLRDAAYSQQVFSRFGPAVFAYGLNFFYAVRPIHKRRCALEKLPVHERAPEAIAYDRNIKSVRDNCQITDMLF